LICARVSNSHLQSCNRSINFLCSGLRGKSNSSVLHPTKLPKRNSLARRQQCAFADLIGLAGAQALGGLGVGGGYSFVLGNVVQCLLIEFRGCGKCVRRQSQGSEDQKPGFHSFTLIEEVPEHLHGRHPLRAIWLQPVIRRKPLRAPTAIRWARSCHRSAASCRAAASSRSVR